MYNEKAKEKINEIERIVGQDVGRNVQKLAEVTRGELFACAYDIATHPSPKVVIVTGFFIPGSTPPAAETDGPIGAAHLASALSNAKIPVEIITDRPCESAVQVAVRSVAENVPVKAIPISTDSVNRIGQMVKSPKLPISHVIAIERVGPSASGIPRNMRGVDISAHTAPLHELFQRTIKKRKYVTIGIGDGGNEIGMGKIPSALIAGCITKGDQIACVTPCDYVIVCGVSNWGGIALIAALALLRHDLKAALLSKLNRETDRHILEEMVYKGPAVDSFLGKQALCVDGIAWEHHAAILDEIISKVKNENNYRDK